MTDTYREFKTTVGGREVTVETGKYAEQTNGSCVIRCGETVVRVNVVMAGKAARRNGLFPLGRRLRGEDVFGGQDPRQL